MVLGKSAGDTTHDPVEELLAQVRELKDEIADLWVALQQALDEGAAKGMSQANLEIPKIVLDVAKRYEEIAELDSRIDGHRRQTIEDAQAAEAQRVPAGYHQLRDDVAQLRTSVGTLRSGSLSDRRITEGLRQSVNRVMQEVQTHTAHLAKVDGVQTRGGVYNQLGVLRREMQAEFAALREEMLDVARREAAAAAEHAVGPVRDSLNTLDDSWRNLRAERVRADADLLREQDHAHHPLASELTNLGTQKARALVTSARPHDATGEYDPITSVAVAVREIMQACLTGPMVDTDGVRNALVGNVIDLEPGDLGRLRRFVDAATRLRARIAATGREVEFDFTPPAAGEEYHIWHPSTEDGVPSFVVVPAYRVGGHTFGLPVVFTELPEVAGD